MKGIYKVGLFLVFFLSLFSVNVFAIDVSTCSNLNSVGATYVLTTDITDQTGYCINISASNITIDCQEHLIGGTGTSGDRGIHVFNNMKNFTLRNCRFTGHDFTSVFFGSSGTAPSFANNITCYDTGGSGGVCLDGWAGNMTFYDINCTNMPNSHCIEVDGSWNKIYNSVAHNISSFVDTNDCGNADVRNDAYCAKVYNVTVTNATTFSNSYKSADIYHTNSITCSGTAFIFSDDIGYQEIDELIYNNYINCSEYADVSTHTHANSDIWWNITNQTGTRIKHPGNESYYIGGNYYTNSTNNGYSDTCTDTVEDGYCDSSFSPDGEDYDYLPYSDEYIDTAPPTFSNNQINTTMNGTIINFSVVITDDTALSGYIFSTNNTGTWINDTWTALASGGTAYNITTLNDTIGVVVNYTFYANDSFDNWEIGIYSLTTTSSDTYPEYSNIQTNNPSNYSSTQKTWMNITWTDESGISIVRIESNFSGSPTNYTPTQSGSVYYLNLVLPAGSHYWKSYANDTADQWNTSTQQNFTISNASNPVNLYLNGTLNSNKTQGLPHNQKTFCWEMKLMPTR